MIEPVVNWLGLNLTDFCNLNCKYCFMNAQPSGQSLKYNYAANFIDFFSTYFVPGGRVLLTGGEPTLNPRLLDIIEYAEASLISPNILLGTNGVIPEKKLDAILQSSVNFYLSFEGIPEIQNFERAFYDSRGSSEKVLHTIKTIIDDDPNRLIIRLNYSKNKIGREKEIVRFFSSLGVKRLSLGALYPAGRGKTYENVSFLECVDKNQDFLKLFGDEGIDTGTSQNRVLEKAHWPSCGAGEKSFFLSVEGELVMCQNIASTENLKEDSKILVVGDAHGGLNIDEQKMKAFMEFSRAVPDACESCFAKNYCGGCFMRKKIIGGKLSFEELYCKSRKSETLKLKRRLGTYKKQEV